MSMKKNSLQLCPACDCEIKHDQINISEGVALCPSCGILTPLSELNYSGISSSNALETLGKGDTISSEHDCLNISFSLFSIPKFLFLLALTLVWNGGLSVFLFQAVAGVYYNLIGPLPEWYGLEDGVPIMNDEPMGPGMTMFFCLFLTPFVVIGAGMAITTLLRLFGTTNIRITQSETTVSTGISFLQLKSKFVTSEVIRIKQSVSKFSTEGETSHIIEIKTSNKTTKFGIFLSVRQQDWLISILRSILLYKKLPKGAQYISWLN